MKLKKMLIGILTVLALLCVSVAAVGCGGEPTVKSVELDKTSAEIFVGESLNYSDYKITVTYSDGKTETVDLKQSMISQTDLSKLSAAGTYEISVTVDGKTVTLTVTVKKYDFDGDGIVFYDVSDDNVVSATYTGEAIIPEVENLPDGAEVVYSFYEGSDETGTPIESVIDAGEYFVKATVVQAKYQDFVLTAKLNVRKKLIDPSTLTWKDVNVFFPGSKVTLAATVEGLPEGIEIASFGGETSATLPGEYTATVTFKGENKNFYYSDTPYDLKWTVTSNIGYDKWYAINGGTLVVAEFTADENDSTKGTLTMGNDTIDYTVIYDETTKLPTFTLNADAVVSSITLNGTILTIVKGETTYQLIFKSFFEKYYGVGYSLYVANFDFVVDETAGTAKAVITPLNGEAKNYNMTLSFASSAKSADSGKITLAGSDVYFQGSISSGNFIFKAYNFVNDQKVDSDGTVKADTFSLVTKDALNSLLATRPVGEFMDVDNNVLRVTENNEFYYNGIKTYFYVESDYNGKPALTITWGLEYNQRAKTLTVVDGYYKLSNVFFDKDFKNYTGEYYLDGDDGLTNAQTVSFNSSSSYNVSTKLILGESETAESKSFDFNAASNKNRFTITKGEGVLTLNLYLADSEEVYAVVTLNADGTATVGTSSFKKVNKIIEKAGYSSGAYYGADGTKLSYDGKGTFTIGQNTYKDYTLTYNGSVVTVTLNADTAIVIKYDYNEKRYVTVDGKYFIYDGAGNNNANGFIFGADYVSGNNKVRLDNGVLKLNGTALTDVAFSFVDDGNNNGRTVLKATAKNGTANVEVVFYSLFAVKVDGNVYTINTLSKLIGVKYKENADASPVVEFADTGKVLYNGTEVIPVFVGLSRDDFKFVTYSNGFNLVKQPYFNDGGLTTYFEGKDYYAEAYFTFNGMYKSADKAFFINDSLVYKDGISEINLSGCTIVKMTSESMIIKFSGDKLATFSVIDGVKTLVYDGDTYTHDDFDIKSIFGNYQVIDDSGYNSLNFSKLSGSLTGVLVENGEYVFKVKYDYSKTAMLIKNPEAATSADLPYLAVGQNLYTIIGTAKVNGKDFVISIGAGLVDNVIKTVLTVTYDGNSANVSRVGYDWKVTLGGIDYKIEENKGENKDVSSILVYEFWLKSVKGSYTFNGRTLVLETVVNASGESIVKVTVDGVVVNHTIAPSHELIEFTKGGVNYKAVINADVTPRIVLYTVAEHNAFSNSFNTEKQCYVLTINEKELSFDYSLKNEFLSYNPAYYTFKFAIDAEKYKYGDSALTFVQYVYEANVLVFTTADGNSYAYNIVSNELSTDVLPENFELVGIKVSGATYGLVTKDITITAKLTGFVDGKAVMTVYYEFGFDTDGVRNAATMTALEGNAGFKLVGKVGLGKDEKTVTTYLIKEDSTYALYTEEQYLLAGTYTVNEKSFVITGALKGGKGTYKATYDNGTETAITVDFTKNEFMLFSGNTVRKFNFTINDGVVSFSMEVLPTYVLDFVASYASYADYSAKYGVSAEENALSVQFKSYSETKVEYLVSSEYNATLSDDHSYIEYCDDNYNKYRIYLNTNTGDDFKFVKVKADAGYVPLIGEHTVGSESIKIEIYATSKWEEDDEDEWLSVATINTGLKITYKGKSVIVPTYKLSSSIEFKIGETTYVATVANGNVTVTEKAAA